ncbi:MAG: caspase family protein [Rubrivivax sp.]|nr:caspase family protein [Rubrivivax sp.]
MMMKSMATATGRHGLHARGRAWALAAAVLLGLATPGPPAAAQGNAEAAQRRTALVIGNSAYADAPLANSANDARAMAQVLRATGFAVQLHVDVDQRQMLAAVREFGERLKATGGTGLFYFAGHGVQIKGRNFLVPIRADITHEDEVAYAALDAQAVLDKMESAGNGTNIIILDACRNNPFVRSTRNTQQGLALMDAPVGTLVAFATAPGSVAIDNLPGMRNGLYTTHLMEAIRRPGLKVEEVMKLTRAGVLRASGNRQMPWETSALVGDFYFQPPREGATGVAGTPAGPPQAPAAAAPAVDTQAAIDDALWAAVKDSRSSAELYAYLQRFPDGRHAREARRRLLDLATPGGAPRAGAAPPAPAGPQSGPSLPGLPAPPPREALPATGGFVTAPPAIDEARRVVEEVVRWGSAGTERRPQNARRNSAGFTEGDRFRYQKTDFYLRGGQGITDYLWRVDRIEPDGSLWVNDGRQRFDPTGQRHGGNDEHTGAWVDFAPPLPLYELARRGAGVTQEFRTTVRIRDAGGQIEHAALHGTLRTHADSARGPRGSADLLAALRIEVELMGTAQAADGALRALNWKHTYWMALPLLLPVAFTILEVVDGVPRQSTRHELIAVDQLSLADPAPAPGATR